MQQTAMLSDQGVRLSILSTLTVTSGRKFSAAESKLTSLIGIDIFNNSLKFIILEEEKSSEMISASGNVQGITICQGERLCERR